MTSNGSAELHIPHRYADAAFCANAATTTFNARFRHAGDDEIWRSNACHSQGMIAHEYASGFTGDAAKAEQALQHVYECLERDRHQYSSSTALALMREYRESLMPIHRLH